MFGSTQPLPHEPVSWRFVSSLSGYGCTVLTWQPGMDRILAKRVDDITYAHVRLANGQLVIVKPPTRKALPAHKGRLTVLKGPFPRLQLVPDDGDAA